jgi:HD superfamily phosphohydrolase
LEKPGRNKRKILNDPVYGFITLRHEILLDLIDHPYFQRLRRITQLGLSHLVYPGAIHNRFHHAIGAMHLMSDALEVLKDKGQDISADEALGSMIAILLHDIGHGPFSHALEHSIAEGVSHETLSGIFMRRLNTEFNGQLSEAIDIFHDRHPARFLHQLVSSQLDMDRLDYLRRDSFYTGVAEGNVGSERIIKMLLVHEGELMVEEKGIYSIEKFLVARRLMYWQVYLHKTVLSAEFMLVNILRRAKFLASAGEPLWASPTFARFLQNNFRESDFAASDELLDSFAQLDDADIVSAIKVWQNHSDPVLAYLCQSLTGRRLFKIEMNPEPFPEERVEELRDEVSRKFHVSREDSDYFIIRSSIDNSAYSSEASPIKLLFKDGSIKDVADASDHFNLRALSKEVRKYFLCYPR